MNNPAKLSSVAHALGAQALPQSYASNLAAQLASFPQSVYGGNYYGTSRLANLSTLIQSAVSGVTATGGIGHVPTFGITESLDQHEKTLKESQGEMLKRFMEINESK